ncbi:MAG: hypothetical protein PHP99_02360 [Paludibacter sp.]|nr:hypothetical protein [Paludibacter sp.]
MGVVFVYLLPFNDPYANSRLYTQMPEMRALISSIRIFFEITTIILVINWILTNKINLNQIIKYISIVLIISVSVGVIDFISGFHIRTTIYPGVVVQSDRVFGLSGEPRSFGRYCAYGLIFLLYYPNANVKKIRNYGIVFSIVGLILSLSASSLIIAIVGVILYMLSQRRIKSTIILGFALVSSIVILNTNVIFKNLTLSKINQVFALNESKLSYEKVSRDEPFLFSRFEVFDRAALNFFFHYPQYLLFGVGPELISIPASPYLTASDMTIYRAGINSTPHTFLVNTLSRSGLVGLILMGLFFSVILRSAKIKNQRYFFGTFLIMSLMVSTSLIYFFTGLTIALILNNRRHSLMINNKVRTVQVK